MLESTKQMENNQKEIRNSPNEELGPKGDVCFHHQFVSSIPIQSLNIYFNQMFFHLRWIC